jgi:hypothetical protein
MPDANATFKSILAVAVGALLYAILNWIPIVGPVAAGLFVGVRVGGGFKRGFNRGIHAGALGCLIIVVILSGYDVFNAAGGSGLLTFFILWVLLAWNVLGVFLAGVGAGFGAVGKDIHSLIPRDIRDTLFPREDKNGVDYLICPVCGSGNVKSASTCVSCGANIR